MDGGIDGRREGLRYGGMDGGREESRGGGMEGGRLRDGCNVQFCNRPPPHTSNSTMSSACVNKLLI